MLITDCIQVVYAHYGTWLDDQVILNGTSLQEGTRTDEEAKAATSTTGGTVRTKDADSGSNNLNALQVETGAVTKHCTGDDLFATLSGLPGGTHSRTVAIPATVLLIEHYGWLRRGFPVVFSALFRCLWKTNRFPCFSDFWEPVLRGLDSLLMRLRFFPVARFHSTLRLPFPFQTTESITIGCTFDKIPESSEFPGAAGENLRLPTAGEADGL